MIHPPIDVVRLVQDIKTLAVDIKQHKRRLRQTWTEPMAGSKNGRQSYWCCARACAVVITCPVHLTRYLLKYIETK